MLIREVWPRRHVAKYWLLIGLDPGLSFHHYLQVTRTSSAFCILVLFSSSAENDAAVSFRFRTENELPFSALVSVLAENAKPGFGRSLSRLVR